MNRTRKKNESTWDSYKKYIPEYAKYIVPFFVGVIIAVSIWFFWQIKLVSEHSDTKFDTIAMWIILLLVELIIAVIEISLTYIYKVVKMKPKSSYKIENIDNYLQAYEQYRKGDYQYETIKSVNDIVNAYKSGKKIVFTARDSGEKAIMWIGIVFWIVGIVVITIMGLVTANINMEFLWIFLSISISMFGVIGASFFLPNFIKLIRLTRSFFVLGREGIVYRRQWGDTRSYSWKELDLKIYSVKESFGSFVLKTEFPPTLEIHVILPNHAKLKFKAERYHLDEFLSLDKLRIELKNSELTRSERVLEAELKKNLTLNLVIRTFNYFFDSSKQSNKL
ncbi:MAG: hypothetical protein ACFFA0_06350 [Promethearchaeota archaeon]